jgi:histidinol-phosphatase
MNADVDDSDVAVAHEMATLATETALRFAADTVAHEIKDDGTPVSEGDLAVERILVEFLLHHRPDDGILSEESGQVATGRRKWLLDPIDGTSYYITGRPGWGTHIALEVDGAIVLGIITRPLRRRRWWAVSGEGAFADDDLSPDARSLRLNVSRVATLSEARIGLYAIGDSEVPNTLAGHVASVVPDGSHILELVEGRLDAVVTDNCGFAWDHAPGVILTTASGGRFCDPEGGTRHDRQGGLYTNGLLDDALRYALRTTEVLRG